MHERLGNVNNKIFNEKIQKFIEDYFDLDEIKTYVKNVYDKTKSNSLSAEQEIDCDTLDGGECFHRFLYYRFEELFFEEWQANRKAEILANFGNKKRIKLAPSEFSKSFSRLLISLTPTSAISFYLNVLFSFFAAQDNDGKRGIFDECGNLQNSKFLNSEKILKDCKFDNSDPLNKMKFFKWVLRKIYPENVNADIDDAYALHVRNPDWLTIYTMFISVINGNDYADCRRKAWDAALESNGSSATHITPNMVNENNVTTSDLFKSAGEGDSFDISKITSMETLCDFITDNARHLGFVHKGLMQYLSVAEKYATSKTVCWENGKFTKYAKAFLDMQYNPAGKYCFNTEYQQTLDSCCIEKLKSCTCKKLYEEVMKKNTRNIFRERYSFGFYFKPFNENATLECLEPEKIKGLHDYCLINEKFCFKAVANHVRPTSQSVKMPNYASQFTVENVIEVILSIFNVIINYCSDELTEKENFLLSNNTVTSKQDLSSEEGKRKALNEVFEFIAIDTKSEIYLEKLENYLNFLKLP